MAKIFTLKKHFDDFIGEISILKMGIPNKEKQTNGLLRNVIKFIEY